MKRLVSIFLAIIMILSVCLVVPMSASAQTIDPDKVYVKTDGQYYEAQKGQIFTYQYSVSADSINKIATFDVHMFYDTEGLNFVPYYDEYGDVDNARHFPKTPGSTVYNFNIDGEIYYNYCELSGIRLDNDVLFTGQFEVTADSGVYEIDSKLITVGDTQMAAIVYQGEKYGEFCDSQIITDIAVSQDIAPETQAPTEKKVTVYFVDTVNANNSRKNATMFVHAIKGEQGSDDYIENAALPGQHMVKVGTKSYDGAVIRKVYLDDDYDKVSFGYSSGYPNRPRTEYVEIKDGWYFDNGTNKWYENLDDIPAYTPTEPSTVKPTFEPTEKPVPVETQKPTTKPNNKYEDVDGLYVVADGVFYKAEKGQKFTYHYCVSVDEARKVAGFVTEMYYDTEGLDLKPYYDEYGDVDIERHFPKVSAGTVCNFNIDGAIYYNYSSLNGVRIDNDSLVFSAQFEVTADSGVYELNTITTSLCDTEVFVIVYEGENYDEFSDSEIITGLIMSEDIEPETQAPTEKKVTIHFVDTVNANNSKKNATMFAHAVKGEKGSNNYVENKELPGQYMAKVGLKSDDGAIIRKVYLDDDYDKVSFGYSSGYPNRPRTEYVEIKDGWYFDNGTNKWYENLADIPAYTPTEPPTVIETEKPTSKPNDKPKETTAEDNSEVFVVADGVTYAANKGDVFEYSYYLSVDSALKISSLNIHMTYDTLGLDFIPYIDEYGDEDVSAHFPRICGGCVHNFGIDGKIYYNYSNVSGIRLVNDAVLFTGRFKVTADKGTYNIDSRIITLADADMNRIVHEGKVVNDVYTEKSELDYPDFMEPTEEIETEPTVEPTDAPEKVPGEPWMPPTEISGELDGSATEYEIGDVNRDGKINVFDATAVQRNSAYYITLTDAENQFADANLDGTVNIFDATQIQRYIAGYITEFEKK